MGPWVDGKLHHIVDSHVVHHLFPDMPFYGAKEATPYPQGAPSPLPTPARPPHAVAIY